MERFVDVTTASDKGNVVIMGHDTFNSIKQPLKGRVNVVISKDTQWAFEIMEKFPVEYKMDDWGNKIPTCGVVVVPDIDEVFLKEHFKRYVETEDNYEGWQFTAIGGRSVYDETLFEGFFDRAYITIVDLIDDSNGDDVTVEELLNANKADVVKLNNDVSVYLDHFAMKDVETAEACATKGIINVDKEIKVKAILDFQTWLNAWKFVPARLNYELGEAIKYIE
jgi:dihydrofolate reductase